MNNLKIDLLKLAMEEIKNICMIYQSNCFNCPLSNSRQVYDDCGHTEGSYWQTSCPFKTDNPSMWDIR